MMTVFTTNISYNKLTRELDVCSAVLFMLCVEIYTNATQLIIRLIKVIELKGIHKILI